MLYAHCQIHCGFANIHRLIKKFDLIKCNCNQPKTAIDAGVGFGYLCKLQNIDLFQGFLISCAVVFEMQSQTVCL